MTITVDTLLDKLLDGIEACSDARAYCRQFIDPQEAWDKCDRPDWMIYLLHMKGKDVKPILLTVWPVSYIKETLSLKRFFFISLCCETKLLKVIRNLYPEPPK